MFGNRTLNGQRVLSPWLHRHQRYLSTAVGGQKMLRDTLEKRTLSFNNYSQLTEDRRTFSNEEMSRRMDILHKSVFNRYNVDFCLFTSIHNINYYADFCYTPFGRNFGLLVPNTESENIDSTTASNVVVSPFVDGGQPYRRIGGYENSNLCYTNKVYTDWQKGNFFYAVYESIQECLNTNVAKNISSSSGTTQSQRRIRIGYEADHMSVSVFTQLESYLNTATPNSIKIELIDICEPVMRQRMVKSKEEQILTENGAKIANIGGEAQIEIMREALAEKNDKLREIDVSQASTNAMVAAIAQEYPNSEYKDTWSWLQSGPAHTDCAHHPVTSRVINKGDMCSMNVFPMISGYYAALERTLFYHYVASDEHLKIWQINCEVHKKGIELLIGGKKINDVVNELNEIYIENDLLKYRTIGYGHSFGIVSYYYGREEGLELREYVDTVLEEGMIVSMEPMLVVPEGHPGSGGYKEHDILIIQKNGQPPKNITNFPYGPESMIIQG